MAEKAMDLMKGTVDILILKTLSRAPMHGYAVSRWIRETSRDALTLEEGALYPALRRLEKKGWLSSWWGVTETKREAKFYELTPEGRARLDARVHEWGRYVEAMSLVLDAPSEGVA